MKICYIIQTHKNPEQIYRLVKVIKESSSQSHILILHSPINSELDPNIFKEFSDVNVLNNSYPIRLGDFSLAQSYLDAINWFFENKIEFDWLINLSGQDYPTQPIVQIEQFLTQTNYEGFMQYFDVLSPKNPWSLKQGYERYFYQYWRSQGYLLNWQKILLKPLKDLVNSTQELIKLETSYSMMIGIKNNSNPFENNLVCYGGSFFMTLSRKCVEFLYKYYKDIENVELVDYYKKTFLPEESFIQTVLVNTNLFKLSNNNHRYIDYSNSRYGHPRIFTCQDYPLLTNEKIHFARKFDITQDSQILDMLDSRIFSILV